MSATQLLYKAAGFEIGESDRRCWLCGNPAFEPTPLKQFVKPTFTDHDKVACPDSDVVCAACVFCHDERSELLALLVGKGKPQRMRNYSHFVVDGEWIPLSKGDKARMADLLLQGPELAIIAISGQKHLIFRAQPGWWQIEEQSVQPFPGKLKTLLATVESLYASFSKSEIGMGNYAQHRVRKFGLSGWWALESQIKPERGSLPFQLALFLAQRKGKRDGQRARAGSGTAGDHLAGSSGRLQAPLPDEHLAAVRGQHPGGGLHQQRGQVRQLALFEAGRQHRAQQ